MKKIIVALFLLVATPAFSATYYINALQTFNGDGTTFDAAASDGAVGAKNTWTGWTLNSTGSSYLSATATDVTLASRIEPAADSITLGYYGSGAEPKIRFASATATNTGAVYDNYSGLTIDGLSVYGTNCHAVFVNPSFKTIAGVTIDKSRLFAERTAGTVDIAPLKVYQTAPYRLYNFTLTDSDISGTDVESGFFMEHEDGTFTSELAYDFTITGNTFHDISSPSNKGYGMHWIGRENVIGQNDFAMYGLIIENNTFRNLGHAAMALLYSNKPMTGHPSSIGYNTLVNIGTLGTPKVNAIQTYWFRETPIHHNYINGINTNAPDGDGIIIDYAFDDTVTAEYAAEHYSSDGVLVYDNYIYGGAWPSGGGVNIWRGKNTRVWNNIAVHCKYGFNINKATSTGNIFMNNTAYASTDAGINVGLAAAASTWINNLSFGNPIDFRVADTGTVIPMEHHNFIGGTISGTGFTLDATDKTGDPLVVDKTIYDFRPTITSPLINNGSVLTDYFTDDYTGFLRAGLWDIGAYEFNSGTVLDDLILKGVDIN